RAMLRISGADLIERGWRPSEVGRRAQRWLGACRHAGVGGDPEAAADRAPDIQRLAVLLVAAQDDKAEQGRRENDHGTRDPADARPGIVDVQCALITCHHCTLAAADWRVIS